ncbi:uncharacterized protein VTP21DRAFT_4154 [Calcarisporiella thermophila]|uniref:uncharacterized protein n=1 Tax=Calcarisporiella thermophila TaxID=911321 RepID=UPI00374419B5
MAEDDVTADPSPTPASGNDGSKPSGFIALIKPLTRRPKSSLEPQPDKLQLLQAELAATQDPKKRYAILKQSGLADFGPWSLKDTIFDPPAPKEIKKGDKENGGKKQKDDKANTPAATVKPPDNVSSLNTPLVSISWQTPQSYISRYYWPYYSYYPYGYIWPYSYYSGTFYPTMRYLYPGGYGIYGGMGGYPYGVGMMQYPYYAFI